MSDQFNECGSFNIGDLKLKLSDTKELLEDALKDRDKRIAKLEAELAEARRKVEIYETTLKRMRGSRGGPDHEAYYNHDVLAQKALEQAAKGGKE